MSFHKPEARAPLFLLPHPHFLYYKTKEHITHSKSSLIESHTAKNFLNDSLTSLPIFNPLCLSPLAFSLFRLFPSVHVQLALHICPVASPLRSYPTLHHHFTSPISSYHPPVLSNSLSMDSSSRNAVVCPHLLVTRIIESVLLILPLPAPLHLLAKLMIESTILPQSNKHCKMGPPSL